MTAVLKGEQLSPQGLSPNRRVWSEPVPRSIEWIILHTTESPTAGSALAWFAKPEAAVSAHVVIDPAGTVWRVVADADVAWHAGVSAAYGTVRGGSNSLNATSLGVELVGYSVQATFPDAQLRAAAQWCAQQCSTYRIPLNHVVGHADVAIPHGRKTDPGAHFPWLAFLKDVAARWALLPGG